MSQQTIPTRESEQDKRGLWRIAVVDLESYSANAYRVTAEKITAGDFPAE
ncbi:hypothetical protein [Arthrobacter sp. H16F315]|nr:hypothetical protein [Arthrobacter sp. H16F315]MDD1477908.1 hypothetical protein [Arthrobacter sp. H16F315]